MQTVERSRTGENQHRANGRLPDDPSRRVRSTRQSRRWLRAPGGLLGLLLFLAGSAVLLMRIDGWPHLPHPLPTWSQVLFLLHGSYLPPEAVVFTATQLGWLVLLYLTLTTLFRCLVLLLAAAEMAAGHGARLSTRLLRWSDRLTLPVMRRLVDSLLVGMLVINLAGQSMSAEAAVQSWTGSAGAAGSGAHPGALPFQVTAPGTLVQEAHPAPLLASPRQQRASPRQGTPESAHPSNSLEHTVVAGDTLWTLAERYYGDGEQYPTIIQANLGKAMPDGRRFTSAAVIYPGWVLTIPLPSHTSGTGSSAGQALVGERYTVREGDWLSTIAEQRLGAPDRWPEIWHLNQGRVMADGIPFTDPALIRPGWVLTLPALTQPVSRTPAPPAPPAPPPSSPPVLTTPQPPHSAGVPCVPASANPHLTITPQPPASTSPARPPRRSLSQPTGGSAAWFGPLLAFGPTGAGLLGAFLVAGGVVAYRRRKLVEDPEEEQLPYQRPEAGLDEDGFAHPNLSALARQRASGVEADRAIVTSRALLTFLDEQGITGLELLTCLERETAISLLLGGDLRSKEQLLTLAEACEEHFQGCQVELSRTSERDIRLTLRALRPSQTIQVSLPGASGKHPAPTFPNPALLVPIGVTEENEAIPTTRKGKAAGQGRLLANLEQLSPLLIASQDGSGARTVLLSTLIGLATTASPEALQIVLAGLEHDEQTALADVPHRIALPQFANDDLTIALEGVHDELVRRLSLLNSAGATTLREYNARFQDRESQLPFLVLALGGIEQRAPEPHRQERREDILRGIARQGRRCGIALLAVTEQPELLSPDLLLHLSTRLVLHTDTEQTSRLLLGVGGAERLASEGEFLLTVGQRRPVHARGLCIEAEVMAECIALMNTLAQHQGSERQELAFPREAPALPERSEQAEAIQGGTAPPGDSPMIPVAAHTRPEGESEADSVNAHQAEPREGHISPDPGGDVEQLRIPLESVETLATTPVETVGKGDERNGAQRRTLVRPAYAAIVSPARAITVKITRPDKPGGWAQKMPTRFPEQPEKTLIRESPAASVRENESSPAVQQALRNERLSDADKGSTALTVPDGAAVPAPRESGGKEPGAKLPPVGPPVRLWLLGTFRVIAGHTEIKDWTGIKPQEVLAYLAAHDHNVVSKEKIMADCWGDCDPERVYATFTTVLNRIRNVLTNGIAEAGLKLEERILSFARGGYRLDPAIFWSDVGEFEERCRRARHLPQAEALAEYRAATALYGGPFQAGDREPDWLGAVRERLRDTYLQAMNRLGVAAQKAGSYEEAIAIYEKLLELEDTLEDVACRLMECYQASGNLYAVKRVYTRLKEALLKEIGTEALPDTQKTYQRLMKKSDA